MHSWPMLMQWSRYTHLPQPRSGLQALTKLAEQTAIKWTPLSRPQNPRNKRNLRSPGRRSPGAYQRKPIYGPAEFSPSQRVIQVSPSPLVMRNRQAMNNHSPVCRCNHKSPNRGGYSECNRCYDERMYQEEMEKAYRLAPQIYSRY